MAALVAGLYRPTKGSIKFNDFDIYTDDVCHRTIRKEVIAMVDQDPTLFKGSVIDNIRYGKLDATEEQVIAAAKQANAHEFITNLAEGYETNVGERGVLLSGGQRQRVVIARAIVRNPALLILDEATSALDSTSADIVQTALDNIVHGSGLGKRTVLIITHRLDSLSSVDSVVVMGASGSVLATGNYNDTNVQKALSYIKSVKVAY